jgi:hypothetical protein
MSLLSQIRNILGSNGANKRLSPSHWPAADGLTQGGRVTFGTLPSQIMAEVDYLFEVNHEQFSGHFLAGPFLGSEEAHEYLDKFADSQKIVVRYDPKNPFKSALDPGEQPQEIAAAGLLTAASVKPV